MLQYQKLIHTVATMNLKDFMIDFEGVCNKNLYSIHVRTTQKAEISAWFMH